jgi:galactokinase
VNLVARETANEFARSLAKKYEDETGLQPQVYISRPSNGAGLVN